MMKQIMILIVSSIIVVFAMASVHEGLQYLVNVHEWISELLTEIFSPGQSGLIVRNLIALLAVPLLIGLIPACFYWLIRKHWLPFFMEIVWIVWLLQAGALVMLYRG